MSRRVQLIRHNDADAQLFLGKEGEVTVDLTNHSLRVHDGLEAGGVEQARADLLNAAVASGANHGKMSATQAAQLAQVLLDLASEIITRGNADTALSNAITALSNQETSDYNSLNSAKSAKAGGATNGHSASVDASGNVLDAGFAASSIYRSSGTDVAVTDGGTGASALTAHGIVVGNGTSSVNVTSAGAAGQVLTSNGASSDPTFQALPGGNAAGWILFNGATGATIAQFGGLSATRVSSGIYHVDFPAFTSASTYGFTIQCNSSGHSPYGSLNGQTARTSSRVNFASFEPNIGIFDSDTVFVVVFGS